MKAKKPAVRHSWEWMAPDAQLCIKEGCFLEREMRQRHSSDAYPTGRYRRCGDAWFKAAYTLDCPVRIN